MNLLQVRIYVGLVGGPPRVLIRRRRWGWYRGLQGLGFLGVFGESSQRHSSSGESSGFGWLRVVIVGGLYGDY